MRLHRSIHAGLLAAVLPVGALMAAEPPSVPAQVSGSATVPLLPARQAAQARLNYMLHCMGCHAPDGSGAPDKGVPSMAGVLGHFLRVPGGREFIVQVPGVMNSALDDRQIAELMNWVLSGLAGASTPPATPAYRADEIRALRLTRPVDVPAARRALVERIEAQGLTLEPARASAAR